jgi:hypothetical protein
LIIVPILPIVINVIANVLVADCGSRSGGIGRLGSDGWFLAGSICKISQGGDRIYDWHWNSSCYRSYSWAWNNGGGRSYNWSWNNSGDRSYNWCWNKREDWWLELGGVANLT